MRMLFWLALAWLLYPLYRCGVRRPYGWVTARYLDAVMDWELKRTR